MTQSGGADLNIVIIVIGGFCLVGGFYLVLRSIGHAAGGATFKFFAIEISLSQTGPGVIFAALGVVLLVVGANMPTHQTDNRQVSNTSASDAAPVRAPETSNSNAIPSSSAEETEASAVPDRTKVRSHVDKVLNDGPTCRNMTCLKSISVRATDVDDDAYISLNGSAVAHYTISQPDDWVDITRLVRVGDNSINFNVTNGKYGGCSAKFDVRINGGSVPALHWDLVVPIDRAPVDASCGTKTLNFVLNP